MQDWRVVFRFLLPSLELRVFIFLDRLPPKAIDSSLPCSLIHSLERAGGEKKDGLIHKDISVKMNAIDYSGIR